MLDFIIEKDGEACVMKLSGSLTIENVDLIKEKLMELFDNEEIVRVNVSEKSDIDFTFLQLMCSAHRTFVSHKKKLCFCNKNSEILCRKIEKLGFKRHTGCCLDLDNSCLWVN